VALQLNMLWQPAALLLLQPEQHLLVTIRLREAVPLASGNLVYLTAILASHGGGAP
jgi:hypothetical protein